MVHTLVIFGASGDLTSRKLIPALYSLFVKGFLPADTKIVGVSRSPFSNDEWRDRLRDSTRQFSTRYTDEKWAEFANRIFYCAGDIGRDEDFVHLRRKLAEIEGGERSSRVYYFSTSPKLYPIAITNLGAAHRVAIEGINEPPLKGNLDRRVVIEKPFGTDLETAKELNVQVHEELDEGQVFRIDHYLGKETVQNLLVLRFANSMFEPIWNRNYIEHVQITVAEEVTVGRRGDYYDHSGVLRDMFQNHLLQLMMVTAMEAPARFEANLVRDEKVKVLQAIRPLLGSSIETDTFRAQYDGYLEEEGVPADSKTATFAALKLQIENWRWNGVPFYLRSGKGMSCRTTQIVIQFRQPPHLLFGDGDSTQWDANKLVIQIQPAEGIQLHFQSKVPEQGMRIRTSALDFRFAQEHGTAMPDAYQRLLLDAMKGDASLFARSDEVELAWGIIDPITEYWKANQSPPVCTYEKGLWGPEACTEWMAKQDRLWFDVCPVLH